MLRKCYVYIFLIMTAISALVSVIFDSVARTLGIELKLNRLTLNLAAQCQDGTREFRI